MVTMVWEDTVNKSAFKKNPMRQTIPFDTGVGVIRF